MATLDQFIRNLRRGVGNAFSERKMRLLGNLAIERITERTRRGYGVSRTGANQTKLKRLSPSYVAFRKSRRRELDSTTSPRKSNLTFSGRLLRSMVIKEISNRQVKWGPKNNMRKGSRITNEQLGEYVAQAGRPFNNLSKQDIRAIRVAMDKSLRESIKKL